MKAYKITAHQKEDIILSETLLEVIPKYSNLRLEEQKRAGIVRPGESDEIIRAILVSMITKIEVLGIVQ